MKKFLLILAAAGLFGVLQAQTPEVKKTTEKEGVKKEMKMGEKHAKTTTGVKKHTLKKHVCNTECKDGKHVYKPGEIGYKEPTKVKEEGKKVKEEVKTTKEVTPKK